MSTFFRHPAGLVVATAFLLSTGSATAEGPRSTSAARRAGLASQREFSKREKRDLEAGELVVRPTNERRGSLKLIGGTSWQLIEAPTSAVWRTVLDTGHYRRFLPQVKDVRLVRKREEKRTLFIRHGNDLLSICYYLDMNVHPDRREVSFRVSPRPECAVKAGWGFYLIRPHGNDETVLVYGIMADIGDGIVPSLMRDHIHEWMLKVPWMVKRLLESKRAKQLSAARRAPRHSPR